MRGSNFLHNSYPLVFNKFRNINYFNNNVENYNEGELI